MDVDRFVYGDPDLMGPVRSMRLEKVRFHCEAGACVEDSSGVVGEVELAPNGRAISLRELRYLRDGSLRWVRTTTFDERGRQAESITRAADGSIRLHSVWIPQGDGSVRYESTKYGPNGRVERAYVRTEDARGRTVEVAGSGGSRSECRYDDEHHREERTEYNEDGSVRAIWRTQSDDARRWLEHTRHNPDGKIVARSWQRYDERGREVQGGTTDEDGTVTCWRSTYDEDGIPRESVSEEFSPDGSLHHRNTRVYDERGNEIEERLYDAVTDTTSLRLYQFDDQDRLVEMREVDGEGVVTLLATKGYDEGGRLAEEDSQEDGKPRSKKVWSYDEQGNWVRITHYQVAADGDPAAMVPVEEERRTISYY